MDELVDSVPNKNAVRKECSYAPFKNHWGAASFLKNINTDKYNVTVISPRNYFVFTPMLAGASVGTVDYKSITQPIREIK